MTKQLEDQSLRQIDCPTAFEPDPSELFIELGLVDQDPKKPSHKNDSSAR
jgi:hypothetical protein